MKRTGSNLVLGRSASAAPPSPPGGDGGDFWQGYGTQWTKTGLEITAPSARTACWPLLVAGGVGALVGMQTMIASAAPGIDTTILAYWPAGLGVGLVVMLLVWVPFALAQEAWGWFLTHERHSIEVRLDGLTIDGRKWFPREAVFSLGIERTEGPVGDYKQALVAIIGTKRIQLLGNLDGPTAQVLGAAVEQAKRQLWQANVG